MPRGQPDYGMYAVKEVDASLSDLGELAARIGSIVIFDRRGDVVDYDNFESPLLKWSKDLSPATSYARYDFFSVKSESQCVKLYLPAAFPAWAGIYRGLGILASLSIGLEFSFSYLNTNCDLILALRYFDGTDRYLAQIKLDPNAQKLYTYRGPADYVEVADTGELFQDEFIFHTIKFVADFSALTHKRLIFNQTEYDTSAASLYKTSPGIASNIQALIWIYNRGAVAGEVWLDNYILTMAEP